MKIRNQEILKQLNEIKKNSGKNTGNADSFGKLLEKSMKIDNGTEITKTDSLKEPSALNFFNTNNLSVSLKEKVESNLNMLETYSNMLKDPGRSIKEIEPFLNKIIDNVKETEENHVDEGKKSPELFNILENILMIARNEQLRMANGDYN